MKRTILLLTFVVTVSCMHAQRMLTLEECRNLAIQNNKELQISGEKIKMADNEKKAAFTKYFPQLSANGAYMWNQKDINLLDMGALSSSLSKKPSNFPCGGLIRPWMMARYPLSISRSRIF